MKRSSSIAALDDSIDIKFGNHRSSYDECALVTSMMLVTIEEESRRGNQSMRKQRSNESIGTLSAASSFSRSSSRCSLRGWGSTTSRKSYKVDLCSLAANDFHAENDSGRQRTGTDRRNRSTTLALKKVDVNTTTNHNNGPSAINHAVDSWGFFLEWMTFVPILAERIHTNHEWYYNHTMFIEFQSSPCLIDCSLMLLKPASCYIFSFEKGNHRCVMLTGSQYNFPFGSRKLSLQ